MQAQVSWLGPRSAHSLVQGHSHPQVSATEDEFDEEASREASRQVREWQQKCLPNSVMEASQNFFAFHELCDTQAELNEEAATSPIDRLPMCTVLSHLEAARACILGILNLVYLCRHLPWVWCLIPVLPLIKPNKPRGRVESHGPISLVAAMFKILDKLLFRRIWPAIREAVSPWEGGGVLGADIMAWLVSELLALRRRHPHAAATYAAFVDGESAYCRPPAALVMTALFLVNGFCNTDLLLIFTILTSLWGTACVLNGLHGTWKVETGLMQGGALSTALFVVLLLLLFRDLKSRGCGIWLKHSNGTVHIPVLGFIDDLLLLADTPRGLQVSLDAVYRWARAIRMRLNIAAE